MHTLPFTRSATALGLVLCLVSSGCSSFYIAAPEHITYRQSPSKDERAEDTWDADKRPGAEDARYVHPEELCNAIRGAAFSRRTEDTVFGTILAAGGAGAAIVGAAEMGRSDGHGDVWTGSWATMAGLGAAALAVGIYYLVRGGEDRAAYWTTNGAIANMQADYRALPMQAPPPGKNAQEAALEAKVLAIKAQAAADQATNAAKDADTRLAALVQYDLKQAPMPSPSLQTEAALAAVDAAYKKKPQTTADSAEVKYQQERATFLQAYDTKGNIAASPSGEVPAGLADDKAKHDNATLLAKAAEDANNVAVLAQNYLTAQQAAWTHCATALTNLATNDAATNQALGASIGAAPGALK